MLEVSLYMNLEIEKILHRKRNKPFVITNLTMHSMDASVFEYIEMKMHQKLRMDVSGYKEVVVVGMYDRSCEISDHEKTGKLTNWQRPTVEVVDDVLILKCFPGKDYVAHYASLVASYFALKGLPFDNVSFVIPTEQECWDAVYALPLDVIEKSDAIVVGSGLFNIAGETVLWQGNDEFLWASEVLENGKKISYAIFQFSFWGDILYRIIHVLAELGHTQAIFTAKIGGIDDQIIPNDTLATGSLTSINGEIVKWDNIFEAVQSEKLLVGTHVNSHSVLLETKDWVRLFSTFTFVDSEVGYFAKAAKEADLAFGYLHFVSNNLSKIFSEDLSNERSEVVIKKRSVLNSEIGKIIKKTI